MNTVHVDWMRKTIKLSSSNQLLHLGKGTHGDKESAVGLETGEHDD